MHALLFLLTMIAAHASAAEIMQPDPDASLESPGEPRAATPIDLQGVVVDRTMTTFGRAFYTEFTKRWSDTSHAHSLVLIVNERPNPRTGSLITITSGRDVIFRGFISPTRSDIERLAGMAVWQSAQRAEIIERIKNNGQGNPDLAAEEL